MSFSGKVKEELSKQSIPSRHCQIAELAAIILGTGKMYTDADGKCRVEIETENLRVAKKCFTLLRKTFNINTDVRIRVYQKQKRVKYYSVFVLDEEDAERVIMAVTGVTVVQKACCRRSFIRGMFLASGSISNPEKSYHFEIVCSTLQIAEQLKEVINSFSTEAKIVLRKNHYIVYIKDGTQIVEMLNIMGAHLALMDLENLRIVKEMRNSINRRVNCETANIGKTVSASVKQVEDIQFLMEISEFKKLPILLREIAEVRLDNPDATLVELGQKLTPAVGKSGVNHRLRKMCEIADRLRG